MNQRRPHPWRNRTHPRLRSRNSDSVCRLFRNARSIYPHRKLWPPPSGCYLAWDDLPKHCHHHPVSPRPFLMHSHGMWWWYQAPDSYLRNNYCCRIWWHRKQQKNLMMIMMMMISLMIFLIINKRKKGCERYGF